MISMIIKRLNLESNVINNLFNNFCFQYAVVKLNDLFSRIYFVVHVSFGPFFFYKYLYDKYIMEQK